MSTNAVTSQKAGLGRKRADIRAIMYKKLSYTAEIELVIDHHQNQRRHDIKQVAIIDWHRLGALALLPPRNATKPV